MVLRRVIERNAQVIHLSSKFLILAERACQLHSGSLIRIRFLSLRSLANLGTFSA